MPESDDAPVLTDEEEQLLTRYMKFYRALEIGERNPTTPAQERFVRVTLGQAGAETIHEKAYAKHMRLRALHRQAAGHEDPHDPENGPTEEWFTRADWKKLRAQQLSDNFRWSPGS
jgi:uncharacterized protein YifE (UPF0438 family)